MTVNHQQARDAAANEAFPDAAFRSENGSGNPQWGTRLFARPAGKPRHPLNLAAWRQWNDDDSRQAIAESTPATITCLRCGTTVAVRRAQLLATQKYCSIQCSGAAAKERYNLRHKNV